MQKFKVLVVDDEKPARDTVACLIDWQATAFEVVATAKNGKEALEKYQSLHPDLIITDIQMPVMDGLALIRTVRQENQKQKFVILSCHEKFSYAREAIQMGVTDYLLKDLLTPQDLYAVLVKVEKELEEQQITGQERIVAPGRQAQDGFYGAARTGALQAVILENLPGEEKQRLVEEYGLNLKSRYLVLLIVQLDDYEQKKVDLEYAAWKNMRQKMERGIKEALASGPEGECFYHQNGEFIVVASLKETGSQLQFISQSYSLASRVQKYVQGAAEVSATIGISRGFNGFNDLPLRHKEALEATKYKFFYGKGKILFYSTVLPRLNTVNQDMLPRRIRCIGQAVEKNDAECLAQEVRALYGEDLQGFRQYNYLKEVNGQMYGLIVSACNSANISYKDVFGCNYLPLQQVEALETAAEMGEWFQRVFLRIMAIKGKLTRKKYSRHIKDALEYIHANYRKNIGLGEIAEALNLHKVYLCRLFKQETGDNLLTYILS